MDSLSVSTFVLHNGRCVVFEAKEPPAGSVEEFGLPEEIRKAGQNFSEAMGVVGTIVKEAVDAIDWKFPSFDGATIEFGFKLSSTAGVVIVSGGMEANFKVTVKIR